MFAWSLTAILLFWVCFLLYMIFAGLFGCHKKNKIEEIDLTNSRGKYEWDGKEYDTLEEQSAAKVGAPDKPCGVGRADANPKLLLNDT